MLQLTDELRRNPHLAYASVRSTSPVLYEPQAKLWMLFDYESVKRALNDQEVFSSNMSGRHGPTSRWLIFLDPPRHTKLRSLLTRTFTPRVVANLEPRIRQISRELLDPHIEKGEIDLATDYADALPTWVIAEMFGIPFEDRPRIKRWSDAGINLSNTLSESEESKRIGQEFLDSTDEMKVYLEEQLALRRASPGEDLLTQLMHAQVDGEPLAVEDLLGFLQLFLTAGTETTTNLINNTLLCFLEHPDQLALLRRSPELLPSTLEEVLRYRSPVQATFRTAQHDVTLHDQVITAGTLVVPMIGSANRDPKQFPEPDRFDITRSPNTHVAFGHGPHFCIGAALSRLEARVALSDLMERLRDFRLASDTPWPPRQTFHIHGPTHLHLRFEPGKRSTAPA